MIFLFGHFGLSSAHDECVGLCPKKASFSAFLGALVALKDQLRPLKFGRALKISIMEQKKLGMSRKRSDTNLLIAEDPRKQRKRAKLRTPLARRLSYGVGHVLNDLVLAVWMSYILVFQTKVLGLSNQSSGIFWMTTSAFDAILAMAVGYSCDNISIPYLSKFYGRRKLWNLIGTILVAGLFPFLLMPCFFCGSNVSEVTLLVYYCTLAILMTIGWSASQVSHLALIPEIAKRPGEMVELNALRQVDKLRSY